MAILALFIAGTIVLTDQLLKILADYVDGRTVIPGLLDIVYVKNRGAAFGMLANQRWLFIIATVIVMIGFIVILFRKREHHRLFIYSTALILGGGIGNLIDRIFLGYVIDYLQLSFFPPVCNFADYCITAGTVLLIIYILFYHEQHAEKEQAAQQESKS